MMLKYDMMVLPVVDDEKKLLGVITHDDAMEILQEESTEDLEMQSGIAGTPDELGYLETPVLSHLRRRFVWVLGLAVLAISSGYVLVSFEHFLDGRFLLALYLPMVVAAGGNTGAQAATSIIRAMSLGEFEPSDYIAAVWKELRVGSLHRHHRRSLDRPTHASCDSSPAWDGRLHFRLSACLDRSLGPGRPNHNLNHIRRSITHTSKHLKSGPGRGCFTRYHNRRRCHGLVHLFRNRQSDSWDVISISASTPQEGHA